MAVAGRRTITLSRDPMVRFLFSRSKRRKSKEAAASQRNKDLDDEELAMGAGEKITTRETSMQELDGKASKLDDDAILKAEQVEIPNEGAKKGKVLSKESSVANAMELPITIEKQEKVPVKEAVLSASAKESVTKIPKKKSNLWRRLSPKTWKEKSVTPVAKVPQDDVDAVATWFNRTFVPATRSDRALETVSSLVVKNFNQGEGTKDKETIKTRVTRKIRSPGVWDTVLPSWGKPRQRPTPHLWYTTMLPIRIVSHQTPKEVVSSNYFRLITQERSVEASSLTSGVPPPSSPALWPVGKMSGMTDMFGKPEPWYKRHPSNWLSPTPEPWWKKAISPWLRSQQPEPRPWHWTFLKRLLEEFMRKRKMPSLVVDKKAIAPPPKQTKGKKGK